MRVIFCNDPLRRSQIDEMYAEELEAAEAAGLATALVSYEALVDEGDAERAVRRVAAAEDPELAVYRGWMVRPESYIRLYDALAERNLRLVNTPDQYRHAHYLPESYPAIAGHTPETVWLGADGLTMEAIHSALRPFGDRPVIVKDFVKSRKHEWDEACFIPAASDREAVERVVGRFLDLQGSDLNEGLVFRAFEPFEPLATHSKSGMPLTVEFRAFFLDAAPFAVAPYWEEGDYTATMPPVEHFAEVAGRVRSRFFTMDVARRTDGEWRIVELGDGQVAGLPDRLDAREFYRSLALRLGI